MTTNMGTADRLLRGFVIGPVLTALAFLLGAGSIPSIVLFVLAGIAFVTAAVGFCPAYVPFGMSTRGGVSTNRHARFGGRSRVVSQH